MKLLGDVPEWQKQLAVELRQMEEALDNMIKPLPVAAKAKCYVAMAHDWYRMGADEEGQKLLFKADSICPGYFKNEIKVHMDESEDYALIVRNIGAELAFMLIEGLKGSK